MDQYSKYKLFSKYILILKGGKMFPGNKNSLLLNSRVKIKVALKHCF